MCVSRCVCVCVIPVALFQFEFRVLVQPTSPSIKVVSSLKKKDSRFFAGFFFECFHTLNMVRYDCQQGLLPTYPRLSQACLFVKETDNS